MSNQELEIVYSIDRISPLSTWNIIYENLLENGVLRSQLVNLAGKEILLCDVTAYIEKMALEHFQVEFNDISFSYTPIAQWEHILINVRNKSHELIVDWDDLVEQYVKQAPFIQAWVSDIDYAFWQNAKDPLIYKSKGKNYQELPMKSNGLPPPLEQTEIDISRNPGRRIIHLGYVEAVGAWMWLSEEFWTKVGVTKTDVIDEFSGFVSAIGDRTIRIEFVEEPFTATSDISTQEEIRKVLYHS